jgi:Glycosyltransferase family 87
MLRRTPFFLYLAAVIAVVSSIGSVGWLRTWSSLTVPSMYPPFGDMRIVQAAIISLQRGHDPHVSNVGDYWGRAFNIPTPWIAIGEALNFTNETHFIIVATVAMFIFVGICAYLLFRYPSFGLLASAVSTSTLVGIERGNVDLVLFCLLLPAALWLPKAWSPIPILAGTLLKLYPVFALAALYIQRHYRMLAVSIGFAIGIFAYLWNELASIQSATPVGCYFAYGISPVVKCFLLLGLPTWALVTTIAAVVAMTLVTAYFFSRSDAMWPQESPMFNLMLIGSSIYIGTFALTTNFDYRLIFLIFCVPFLCTKPFPLSGAFVATIVVAMNETLLMHWFGLSGHVVVELAKISVFVVLGGYLSAIALKSRRGAIGSSNVQILEHRFAHGR